MRKYLGPGILFAATAIGVSHLVQSTRAGADYGWNLWWIILLANVIKFPFFEFGTRYANATGKSLIDGYKDLGKWAVWAYSASTLVSIFTVTGAVSIVTAGLFAHLTHWSGSFGLLAVGVFVLCFLWLALGKFKFLNRSIKLITGLLFISTFIAFASVVGEMGLQLENSNAPDWTNIADITFVLALVGWMPTAVDLSVWNSIWTVEKMDAQDVGRNKNKVIGEFHLGYWLSAVLALLFLGLGTLLMYGGEELPNTAVGFTGELISLYTTALGPDFRMVIVLSASAAMFSTTLSVFDGYGRTIGELTKALWGRKRMPYWLAVGITAFGGWILVWKFQDKLSGLVDLAMLISFVIAPLVATLNHILVHKSEFPATHRPRRWLTGWSILGLIVLSALTAYYIWRRIFM